MHHKAELRSLSEASTETARTSDSEFSGNSEADDVVMTRRELAAMGGGLSGLTTVMVRKVPPRYSQAALMAELNRAGFTGSYDFFYLPLAIRSKHSRGFAFINFLEPDLAEKFYRHYHGQFLCKFKEPMTEPLEIVPADTQGFEANAGTASLRALRRARGYQNQCPVLLPKGQATPKPADCQDLAGHAKNPELKHECTPATKA